MELETLVKICPVEEDQWEILARLWQAFRAELASIVNGYPYADGRYQAAPLDQRAPTDTVGYIAWQPHPKTGENAPIGFALVSGLQGKRRRVVGFWVAPAARRQGIGEALITEVIARHPGPWSIGFQDDNRAAGRFWRATADTLFGPGRWSERRRAVPGLPEVAPDHIIESNTPLV